MKKIKSYLINPADEYDDRYEEDDKKKRKNKSVVKNGKK